MRIYENFFFSCTVFFFSYSLILSFYCLMLKLNWDSFCHVVAFHMTSCPYLRLFLGISGFKSSPHYSSTLEQWVGKL